MRNVLFICSRNRLRSPTLVQVFSTRAGLEVASAGLNNDADNPVTPEPLEWADMIFVMEKVHRSKLSSKSKKYLGNKKVICLDIPDEYAHGHYFRPPAGEQGNAASARAVARAVLRVAIQAALSHHRAQQNMYTQWQLGYHRRARLRRHRDRLESFETRTQELL